jgi:Zn-dependent peptidase ImmA (M78 family)
MQNDEAGPALTVLQIEMKAQELRSHLGLAKSIVFNIVGVLQRRMTRIFPDFQICTASESELGTIEAYTEYNPTRMIVRADVFELASYDEPRYRFSLAHEVGHLMLHPGIPRPRKSIERQRISAIPRSRSLEAQADTFAGFFLMPRATALQFDNPEALARKCRVSRQAAEVQLKILGVLPSRNRLMGGAT